jgi:membrane protease YdiL (CAAX protease family)
MIKTVFKGLISFLRKPVDDLESDSSIGFKVRFIAILFLIEFPVILCFGVIFSLIKHFDLLNIGDNKVNELLYGFSYPKLILITVLVVPFIEEIIFRLPLKYNRNYLTRFVVYCISLTGIIGEEKLEVLIQKYWKASFKYLFYFLALAFGFIHLTNFNNSKELILFTPLLTITQTTIGLIMGYIRVKHGFIWGYYYHAFHNFVFISLAFLSIHSNLPLPYHFKNETVSIEIIECNPQIKNGIHLINYSKIKPDTIILQKYKIKEMISDLCLKQGKYIISPNLLSNNYYNVTSAYNIRTIKSGSSRGILLIHLQKAFGIIMEKQTLKREAWELYMRDSALLPNDPERDKFIQVKGNLKNIARHFDRLYNDELIFSDDMIHQKSLNVPYKMTFDKLREYLNSEYGIGLRKVTKEFEFIFLKRR